MSLIAQPFYFMRHGETEWNQKSIPMGQSDIPLNQKGLSQALLAAQIMEKEFFKSIVVSPLKRAKQTAEIISSHTSTAFTVIEELKEACFGIHEGKQYTGWGKEWMNGKVIKGAEPFTAFIERVRKALKQIFNLPSPVLVISHMGVYNVIQMILAIPSIELENCEVIYHTPPSHITSSWTLYKIKNTGKIVC